MEKTYDLTTSCKASGVVKKIIGGDMTINNCGYYYRLKLNDGTRDYVIRGLEKNDIGYGELCENNFYAFSGGELPKVGDEMHVIAQYNDSWILNQGKETFDKFNYLVECPITADGSLSYDAYLWADKCKISGVIENLERTLTDKCGLNLGIEVKNGENSYMVLGREYFTGKNLSLCLGVSDGWYPIDITDGKITTNINIGENFYAILDKNDNSILKYGKNDYNNSDNSIPVCTESTTNKIETFSGGLTENQINQVMKGVEKEIIKTYPDLNKQLNLDINSSSGTISNTIENTEEKTIAINTKVSKNTQQNILPNNANSGTKTEIQTGTGEIQESVKFDEIKENINIVNTGTTQVVQPNIVQDTKYKINYISYGILLIFLLLFLYYKLLKIKK